MLTYAVACHLDNFFLREYFLLKFSGQSGIDKCSFFLPGKFLLKMILEAPHGTFSDQNLRLKTEKVRHYKRDGVFSHRVQNGFGPKKVLRRLSRNRLWLWFPIDFLNFFSKIFFCNFFFRQNFRKISFKDFDISSIKIFYNDFFRIFFFKKYFFFWPKIDQPSITPVAS